MKRELTVPSKSCRTTGNGETVLSVTAIQDGTVIDHINVGKAIRLLQLLKLESHNRQVTVGLHLPSGAMTLKDIIKIEGRELSPAEASKIAIFAPKATINIIQNYRVVDKYKVTLPPSIEEFVICPNANCITNHERAKRAFFVNACKKEIALQCRYCEKAFNLCDIAHYDL